MNNLMKFENQKVEVFEFDGKVLFNPYDVGNILDVKNVRDRIRDFNDNQRVKIKKSTVGIPDNLDIPTAGRVYLTESGVYKLIFKSRKKEAERFCDWVTDEVLPTIRQTGKYETKQLSFNIQGQKRKMYKGQPVLIRSELEKILGVSNASINQIAKKHNIGVAILSGTELDNFKRENPGMIVSHISNVRLYNKDDVMKISKILNVSYDNIKLDDYFYEELSDYDKLWRVQLAGDIQNITRRIGNDSVYRKMLFMVTSKIYMGCGLLDGIYDDLDVFNVVGHNLSIRVQNFKNNIKLQLTK